MRLQGADSLEYWDLSGTWHCNGTGWRHSQCLKVRENLLERFQKCFDWMFGFFLKKPQFTNSTGNPRKSSRGSDILGWLQLGIPFPGAMRKSQKKQQEFEHFFGNSHWESHLLQRDDEESPGKAVGIGTLWESRPGKDLDTLGWLHVGIPIGGITCFSGMTRKSQEEEIWTLFWEFPSGISPAPAG